tara:strand:+ start:1252 stop:1539 length:288 start_codon:yes stop_codon:yes gene_type:complete
MKTFAGVKPHDQIIKDAIACGLSVDTTKYDGGSDYINVWGNFCGHYLDVAISTWNGVFFTKFDGDVVTNRSSYFDGVDWYDEILDLVYVQHGDKK